MTTDDPYHCETEPFTLGGEWQIVEASGTTGHVRRCRWPSRELTEETVCPYSPAGSAIEEIGSSPGGN